MTGGSKNLKIADMDNLELSNMNRLRGSLTYLNKSKVELASNQIWEIDPFIDIELWDKGIVKENLRKFIGDPRIDVMVDEIDDLKLKILLRIEAKRLHVPVVMATDNDDGVLIDIERFDIEPGRPIFHGLVGEEITSLIEGELSPQQRVDISSKIVGKKFISERMFKSLSEVGKSIPTWPQLGTAASMSGAVAAYVVREIVAGKSIPSQRSLITPNAILKKGP